MRTTLGRSAIALAACALAACGSGGAGSGSTTGPAPAADALTHFEECDELHAAIVDDARQRVAVQAETLRRSVFVAEPPPTPAAAATPAPGGPTAGDGPDDFTDTNAQVPGVDEADVVESDGRHLYLLHEGALLVLTAWPPEATALAASVAIEGQPTGMFVDGDRALVLSAVSDPGALGGADSCHVVGPPLPPFEPFDAPLVCDTPFTKLTLIDLATTPAAVVRELYLEGHSALARRHGDVARVVVQRTWGLPAEVPEAGSIVWALPLPATQAEHRARVDAWEAAATAAVAAAPLAAWLPAALERRDDALVPLPARCGDVHVPPARATGDGSTRILTLDMRDAGAPLQETTILGAAASLYAGATTLVLAQPDWSWSFRGESTDRTALHVFALETAPAATTYLASGIVPGIPLSQFAFDVRDEVIRVATTVSEFFAPIGSRITTFRVDGGTLVPVGATPDVAPGERIFAVRFLDTRAYLVTFEQIDPLFVVDLSDPAAPAVLGELEIPGFSEYIHPLGDRHLLTIGQDADLFGRSLGVALRIFDVSDPTAPALAHMETLPGTGWSIAATNHLAFTFDPSRGLLALPYSRYDGTYRSSLVLLGVDAETGFDPRGEVAHDHLADGCPLPGLDCGFLVEMQRGLFIEDWLYSISTHGVLVNAVHDLGPVATVALP